MPNPNPNPNPNTTDKAVINRTTAPAGVQAFYILFAEQVTSSAWPEQICQNAGTEQTEIHTRGCHWFPRLFA
jgi:hypothetical protein